MPELEIDYRAVLQALTAAGVRFVIIGGVAMHLLGANNLTLDIDVSYSRDPENLRCLARVLSSQHARYRDFPPDLPCIIDPQALRNATNLTLQTDLGDFDLLAEPAGVESFEALYERATTVEIAGATVRVASIPDVIAMKRAANRPKDREHVMQLLALQRLLEGGADSAV